MSKLYIVGTPIGNLSDLSPRGARILAEVDFIAAEDTRVTLRLLNHLGLKKTMVSYFEHNLRQRGQEILARIIAGESCAVVTDAGMPCISDPGEDLVRLCAQAGIPMEVVPGPSALISALALSGLPTGRFVFEGFLSVKRSSRKAHLEELRQEQRTIIFYEAPHKLLATLQDLHEVLGDRRIAVCKELTKLHETVLRATLSEAVFYYTEHPPKGEYVLVLEGAPAPQAEEASLEDAADMVRQLVGQGMAPSRAAKEAAAKTGLPRSQIYAMALGTDNEE